jgi:uncharacterized protein YegJ (DUF2314 family)
MFAGRLQNLRAVLLTWLVTVVTHLVAVTVQPASAQDTPQPALKSPRIAAEGVILLLNRPLEISPDRFEMLLASNTTKEFVLATAPPTARKSRPNAPAETPVKPAEFTVEAGSRRYLIRSNDRAFLSKEQVADVEDLRVRNLLRTHTAWIAVDPASSQAVDGADVEPPSFPQMCRVLALCLQVEKDADESVLGILIPSKSLILAAPANVSELLESADPLAAFNKATQMPVLDADNKAAELQAATTAARKRWPEFVQAFQNRQKQGPDSFNVLFSFREGDQTESMWVEVTELKGNVVEGTLANEPALLRKLKSGAFVRRNADEIADWIYTDSSTGQLVGGFLVEILTRQTDDNSPDSPGK